MLSESQLSAMKGDEKLIRAQLESAGVRFKGRTCKCCFHDDGTASAGIFLHDSVWFFKCHGCGFSGTFIDVAAKLGKITPEEVLSKLGKVNAPPPAIPKRRIFPTIKAMVSIFPRVEETFTYAHPSTKAPEMIVIRFRGDDGKKKFAQGSPVLGGGFTLSAPPQPWPIYNRARVAASPDVIVVEGEKCVKALHGIGTVATTSPGGAGKATHADWTPLAGKTVFLWPDNDAAEDAFPEGKGIAHMRDVAKILLTLTPAPTVFWIDISKLELPPKGDAADYIERYKGWKPEEIKATLSAEVLAEGEQLSVTTAYTRYVEDAIQGKRRSLPFHWPILTKATRALIPGKLTCIIGDPGSGKSLWVMEMIVAWTECGIKVCVYELEDAQEDHLARAHAQVAGNSNLTDAEWIEANPDAAREYVRRYQEKLNELARCIFTPPDEQPTLDHIALWIETKAKEGYEIIIVDPITAAKPEKSPWIADCEFVVRVKTIARRHGCRVIVVAHFKKGHKGNGGGLDDIAGGAAWGRLTHTAIWLEVYEGEEVWVKQKYNYPAESVTPNRIAKILKARNGPGRSKRIAFDFQAETLRYQELGIIEKEGAA